MTGQEFEKWYEENATGKENKYCNDIDYIFCTMKDSWIAIFEYNHMGGINEYIPIIQALDEPHALDYISVRERINFPINKLA